MKAPVILAVNIEMEREEMLLFFSSGLYPRYARDVLDALCYPADHVIHFRYRNDLIEKVGRDPREEIDILTLAFTTNPELRTGLIVYADGLPLPEGARPEDPAHDFVFYPVRFVEVLKPLPQGDWVYIPLRLSSVFTYSNENWGAAAFNQHIHNMTQRPRRRHHPNGEGYLVYRADEILKNNIIASRKENFPGAWERIIKDLRTTKRFKENTLFYRVDELTSIKEKYSEDIADLQTSIPNYELNPIKPVYSSKLDQSIYYVKADAEIRFRIIIYQSPVLEKPLKIKLNADANIFTGMVNYVAPIDSSYNEESIFLRSKRATESSLTSIALESIKEEDKKGNEEGKKNDEPDLLAPRPHFLVKVNPSYSDFIIAAFLLTAGQSFLSLDKLFLRDAGFDENIAIVFSKIFGFIFTLSGIALAFRKLKL